MTIRNGFVSTNIMDQSAALQDGGGILNRGELVLRGCTIVDNEANYGGGIYNTGSLVLEATTIRDNLALDAGGGIYSEGTLELVNSTISGNSGLLGAGFTTAPMA